MKVKVFTIRLISEKFHTDQTTLNDFLETVKFVKSATHFVEADEVNYWSVMIHFEDLYETKKMEEKKEANLNEKQLEVFQSLKQWRAEKAGKMKMANFMVCHNSELIDIAFNQPKSIDELRLIKGFGNRKTDKYGDDIIAVLNAL
jgi:ribonuclease D